MRNLTNNSIATIENCESEPIHIPGSIQPHGVLLGVADNGRVLICSANIHDLCGCAPAEVLNHELANISEELSTLVTDGKTQGSITIQSTEWHVLVHPSPGMVLVELEKKEPNAPHSLDSFEQTAQFVAFLERVKTLQELCYWTAIQVKKVTGYDRVMVYRFDKDYNGEVFAESKNDNLDPFLHLNFPHTDIPRQARELYLRNVTRMIVDVHYEPCPLFTFDEGIANPDLSDVSLRSVSPIHIQYLRNMGVGATLTISIILDGQLWGLVACHQYGPKYVTPMQRQAALLQVYFLTSQIKVRQAAEHHDLQIVVEAHLQQLLNSLQNENSFSLKFQHLSSLLAVTNSSGVAVMHKGQLYEKGILPPRDKLKWLFKWLAENISGLQFYTSNLAGHIPEAEKFSGPASGILYHKLGDATKDAIIWFREERERVINWAGDPYDTIKKQNTVNKLTPRTSFAIFKESIRNVSTEWDIAEVNAASRFASTLQNQFHLEYLHQEETRQRLLNDRLQRANRELENINWITSHDLREPIRKILLFSSKIMTEEEKALSDGMTAGLFKIQNSAHRMQHLVNDIISYSLTDDKTAALGPVDLNIVFNEIMETFSDEISTKKVSFMIGRLPVINGIQYQLQQLFVNLVSNALKFAKQGMPLTIEVTSQNAKGTLSQNLFIDESREFHLIQFRDNGIGFDNSQRERIFNIFYRLHNQQDYAGTGMGLAICKRIVENHEGFISATGYEGEGAVFNIYLPVG
jgi:two-component system, chemotaxis family, sensor kinase Cph1